MSTPLTVARDRVELAVARAGLSGHVAVVMTMGALHDGHVALIRAAHERAGNVLVTVFVNPLQFGAGEDFESYPRPLSADLELCEREQVAVVFAPPREVVYPREPRVTAYAGPLGTVWEGASRPGHFDGVLTVVAKLAHLTRPDLMVFGEKDAQQLALVRAMVADLDFGVEVLGVPTVRAPDGLALSSRNAYLDPDERQAARALGQALHLGAQQHDRAGALAAARAVLDAEPGIRVDYLALVGPDFEPDVHAGPATLLVAAYAGPTRLIDNMSLQLGPVDVGE